MGRLLCFTKGLAESLSDVHSEAYEEGIVLCRECCILGLWTDIQLVHYFKGFQIVCTRFPSNLYHYKIEEASNMPNQLLPL